MQQHAVIIRLTQNPTASTIQPSSAAIGPKKGKSEAAEGAKIATTVAPTITEPPAANRNTTSAAVFCEGQVKGNIQ